MERRYCSHCQGTTPGTQENPTFSIREDFEEFHGYPVVEILKNGGPIHSCDSHFRFGRRKAEMVLTCLPALREFGWSTDEERLSFEPRIFEDRESGISVKVFVEMHPDFEWSTGEFIDRPWLRLQAMPPDDTHLGLGVMKCRAVWSVQGDLRVWLLRQYFNELPAHEREKLEKWARDILAGKRLATRDEFPQGAFITGA